MDEFKSELFRFLDTLSTPIIAAENGTVIYTNSAAGRMVPDIAGTDASDIFGPELSAPGAAVRASWRGQTAEAADMGPLRLITVATDRTPLWEERSFVEAVVSGIHVSLSGCMNKLFEVTKRVREAGDLGSIRQLAAMDKNICQVLRIARNLGRVYGDQDSVLAPCLLELGVLARGLLASVGCFCKDREVKLELVCEREVEFYGDGRLLEIMLMELVSNAVKYSRPGGTVTVTVGASGGSAMIKVSDSGNGDDPERIMAMRERFGIPAAALDPNAGAGLGLRVVRRIAQLHGGAVISETRPGGAGTTVTVALPITESPTDTGLSQPESYCLDAFNILIQISDIADDSIYEERDVL